MNPMYLDRQPADHNRTMYSTPKKATRQISYKTKTKLKVSIELQVRQISYKTKIMIKIKFKDRLISEHTQII
jgi:hypothetical protein